MNNPRLLAFVAALAVTAPAWSAFAQQPAAAPPSKEAQAEAAVRFKKGLELFNESDFQAALIEFRRAYDLAPNFAVLYNIGQVYFQLQDYARALTTLERYLADGGKDVKSGVRSRAEVEKDIAKLKSRVANIEITVNVPDAEITIDDTQVGKSPLAKPVLVSAGKHKVTVSKAGFTSATKVVEIASAEVQKVTLELSDAAKGVPVQPVGPEPPPSNAGANSGQAPQGPVTGIGAPGGGGRAEVSQPQPQPQPAKGGSSVWVGWVVTGGLVVGAAVCGGLALSASKDLTSLKKSATATREGLDSAKSKAQTLAGISDGLSAAALVAGGVTLYFTIKGASAAGKGALAPEVKVGLGVGGVRVGGAF